MLNWAIRYRPILLEIQRQKPAWVLDLGSGPEGLKMFWGGSVVGVDLNYKRKPLHNAIQGDVLTLPFEDASCPFVVSCDLIEHIPPEQRSQAISEISRVATKHLMLVFPAGEPAESLFYSIAEGYRLLSPPEWLRQHLEYGLPDVQQVKGWLSEDGWQVTTFWFETVKLHKTLLYLELRLGGKLITYFMMRFFGPRLIEHVPIQAAKPNLRVMLRCVRSATRNLPNNALTDIDHLVRYPT